MTSIAFKEFQLAKVEFNRDGEKGSEAPGVGNCGINI